MRISDWSSDVCSSDPRSTSATSRISLILTSVIIIDFSFSVRNPGGQCPLVVQRYFSGKFFVDCLLHIALDAGCEMPDYFVLEAAIAQAPDFSHNAIVERQTTRHTSHHYCTSRISPSARNTT